MKTSLYTVLCITIRAGAVIWAVGSLAHLPFSWVAALNTPNSAATVTWLLCGVGFQLLVTGMLWLYPGTLARLAAGRASHEFFESAIPATKLQYVALSVVGAWFALQGMVFLSYELIRTVQFTYESLPIKVAALTDAGSRLVLGIALMLGARGLTGVLNSIRERGQIVPSVADNVD